ncbi:hypothetical protein ZIOFF_036210 [Zingiber officinale]|uniref:Myb-like domain-containing protein n=1 Tax=Zingiber officinale TaxID=94328 RepID=A0A8J5GB45_ZINOF|nr:hypothetical protein ZIOFF_036210 [Zingiber officinale]
MEQGGQQGLRGRARDSARAAEGGGVEGDEHGGRWWDLIADRVPGKTAAEVRQHYEVLVEDVEAIEAPGFLSTWYQSSSLHLRPIVSCSNFNKRMVLTRLQEKKIHSDMTTGGSHPDAKWALEFDAKQETRMDKLEKTMASLVTIVQELKDRLEVDFSSSILIKRGKNQQSRQQQYDQGANSNEDREHNYPHMKVEFPRWENNDPIGWISRAEKYFRFHSTSDNAKVICENPSHYSTPRRLTKEEIKERMTKGLCWHCDEKWHRGHQCKQKRILMIEPIEKSEEEDDFDEGETQDNINEVHFGTTNVEYLGHIVSQNRVAIDPSKVLVSKSIKALRDVLDLTDTFRWCLEAKKIFQNLKEAMMTTLVLALPNKQFPPGSYQPSSTLPSSSKEKQQHHHHNQQQDPNSHPGLADRKKGRFDIGGQGKNCSKADQERWKGTPWTEEEHRFLALSNCYFIIYSCLICIKATSLLCSKGF